LPGEYVLPPTSIVPPEVISTEILMEKFGKVVVMRDFRHPGRQVDNFLMFSARSRPVMVFAMTSDKKVVAIRQFRHAANKVILEIPGGSIKGLKWDVTKKDGGVTITEEAILEAAKEELLEETGYSAGKMVILGKPTYFEPSSFEVEFYTVLALNCEKIQEPKPESTELLETLEIPVREWFFLEHNDSKTESVTLKAVRYFGQNGIDLLH
jgi:8-oxo-dGTP pyrophosphatase MutT (NUDIX family)